jgi:hypothetical protein
MHLKMLNINNIEIPLQEFSRSFLAQHKLYSTTKAA